MEAGSSATYYAKQTAQIAYLLCFIPGQKRKRSSDSGGGSKIFYRSHDLEHIYLGIDVLYDNSPAGQFPIKRLSSADNGRVLPFLIGIKLHL